MFELRQQHGLQLKHLKMKNIKRPSWKGWFFCFKSVIKIILTKKYLANQISHHNFAPVLCDSLIKKGRGKWPDDALAT
jgi:hypothetical protein